MPGGLRHLLPSLTQWKERRNSCKESSDLHTDRGTGVPSLPPITSHLFRTNLYKSWKMVSRTWKSWICVTPCWECQKCDSYGGRSCSLISDLTSVCIQKSEIRVPKSYPAPHIYGCLIQNSLGVKNSSNAHWQRKGLQKISTLHKMEH